jgi:hypothetical protein
MKILKNMALLGLLCSGYSMMAMDEDEEFKRAIAESLKESQQGMGGSRAGQTRMTMTSFGQGSSSRQPQVTNSNRPSQEMAGPQAGRTQMPMSNLGQGSSSRQPQITNSNQPRSALPAFRFVALFSDNESGFEIAAFNRINTETVNARTWNDRATIALKYIEGINKTMRPVEEEDLALAGQVRPGAIYSEDETVARKARDIFRARISKGEYILMLEIAKKLWAHYCLMNFNPAVDSRDLYTQLTTIEGESDLFIGFVRATIAANREALETMEAVRRQREEGGNF